jgi:hypothetical protein
MDNPLRDALLKQNGETSVDAQLKVLEDLVTSDRRYVRRLTIATVAVWATWVTMMAVGLGLPMVLAATAPRPAGPPKELVTANTTTTVPLPGFQQRQSSPMGVVAAILVVIVLAVFYALPLAGIILLVMLIAARRTATMTQIQASLLSINAVLKQLLIQKTPPTGAQG